MTIKIWSTNDILLVEDRRSHQDLVLEAFEENNIPHQVHIVGNGEEALDFLQRRQNYANAPRPDLIVLDLNLPKMDGRELLGILKQHPDLKTIPVVVFSSSSAASDVLGSYSLHANSYVTKPTDLEQFFAAVQGIVDFWLKLAALPSC